MTGNIGKGGGVAASNDDSPPPLPLLTLVRCIKHVLLYCRQVGG